MSAERHDVPGRMSLCGHHVPDEDVPVEDVLVKDISVEDMMSLDGCPCGDTMSLEDVLDGDDLGKDIKSTQGHKLLARMSLCGHHVPNKDVPVEDVLDGDVPVKHMSVEDMMSLEGCPCGDTVSLPGTSLAGTSPART